MAEEYRGRRIRQVPEDEVVPDAASTLPPGDQVPAGSQAFDAEPLEPIDQDPVTAPPVYDEPVYDEPTFVEPTYEEPTYEEPIQHDPGIDEPVPPVPVVGEPTPYELGHDLASQPEQTYDESDYDEQAYEEPLYDQPVPHEPVYDEPVHESEPIVVHEHRAPRRGRGLPGCLAVLVALAVLTVGAYFGVTKGMAYLSDRFGAPDDFAGPGTGEVVFEVSKGDTVAEMGRGLKAEGVVASVQSFIDAANANPESSKIQAGFYPLMKEMKASQALDVLVDPGNQVRATVTVPEGLRVDEIVEVLAEKTDFSRREYKAALKDPVALGLPDYAEGNPEGYLFPATYDIAPNASAQSILAAMVTRWRQAADEVDLEGSAEALGYTPAELMVMASLIEAEGRGDDMPKIARVLYNRLENPDNGVTNGLLQVDASVNYGAGNDLGAVPTTEDLAIDSPYNTYQNQGLPPTPIEAPGDAALAAAANPADGDWLFYVTVNLATGETKFASTYDEFLGYKDELRSYCENESAGAC